MTLSVFFGSMTAVAIAAMLILVLTWARGPDADRRGTVDVRSDNRKQRRP